MTPFEGAQDDKRTVFYARDIHQMNLILGRFLQRSGADTVLLVDEAGHLVARQGETAAGASEDTITALVAGSFQAARAMAEMLGTSEFSSLIPRGNDGHVMLLRAGEHALLGVVLADNASIPLVRTYALEAIRRVVSILGAQASGDPDEKIQGHRFDKEIDGALSDVFG